ncbi:Gfo/Idh/MocA family oxidoreductase [bacterium]|nr:Gfo/Idh/MocA family oxidoreductase [bacterium]
MNRKVNIGIIGCGIISSTHLQAYKTNKEVSVKAVVDIDSKKAMDFGEKYGVKWYENIDQMLDCEPIDAVSVCTPPKTHHDIVLELAKRKIHVLCEKPLATNTEDAKDMIQIASKNRIKLLVAMCHRFHKPIIELKKIVDSGQIGKIVGLRNRFHWGYSDKEIIRMRGGNLLDTGAHSVDIFRFLVGEVRSVIAVFNKGVQEIEDIRFCTAILESANEAFGVIELDGRCPGSKGKSIIELYGDKGSGVIDYKDKSFYQTMASKEKISLQSETENFPNRFELEIKHFIDCIKGRTKPKIDGIEGLKDLEVIEAIVKAGKQGKRIKL